MFEGFQDWGRKLISCREMGKWLKFASNYYHQGHKLLNRPSISFYDQLISEKMVQGFLDDVSMSARFYDKKRKSVKNLFDCYFNILLAITAWFMHVCSQKSSTSSFKIKKISSSQKFVMNFNYDNLTFSNVIIWLCTVWTKPFGPNPAIATVRTVTEINRQWILIS